MHWNWVSNDRERSFRHINYFNGTRAFEIRVRQCPHANVNTSYSGQLKYLTSLFKAERHYNMMLAFRASSQPTQRNLRFLIEKSVFLIEKCASLSGKMISKLEKFVKHNQFVRHEIIIVSISGTLRGSYTGKAINQVHAPLRALAYYDFHLVWYVYISVSFSTVFF